MNHFLELSLTPADALRDILSRAAEMKAARKGRPKGTPDDEQPLSGRIAALMFEKPSTRTRVSFDVGTRQLGGQTLLLSGPEIHMGRNESVADTARVLSRYVDLVMIRTFDSGLLAELADHSDVPVINGLTDSSHPCQIMADVMTFEERRGSIKGKKVVWSGAATNICSSLVQAAGQFGFEFTYAGPEGMEPDPSSCEFARSKGAVAVIERDPFKAVQGADLVMTDTWVSMHELDSERAKRRNMLEPYRVDAELMSRAKPDALFMHCLPAHREEEVTSEVMDGSNSAVFDEAENRLHVQKSIMRWCLQL